MIRKTAVLSLVLFACLACVRIAQGAAVVELFSPQGSVKVWIYNGIVLSKDQESEEDKYAVKRKTR